MHFVYVKVPVVADSDARDRRLHEGIEAELVAHGLGTVLGWGGSLSDPRRDGSRALGFHRIDIEVVDLEAATALLKRVLPALGAPPGTEIHSTPASGPRTEVCAASGWRVAAPPPGAV
ncbi:MAG: hypothetical protein ABT20_15200 [Rubrivivax sp. SCN 70-15]|nr:MAG: hypothetical protein ABT20_15200 [Rubrivivax sp. SCN 70-15]